MFVREEIVLNWRKNYLKWGEKSVDIYIGLGEVFIYISESVEFFYL